GRPVLLAPARPVAPGRPPRALSARVGEPPMTVLVTTFDKEYSDPAATAVDWDQTRQALETAELFWISTVRADGRPHVTPVVAAWAEGVIWFSTGDGEQKR